MRKFGEILIENDLITTDNLNEALATQKTLQEHKPIGEILVDMGLISIETLMEFLEIQLLNKSSS